MECQNCLEEASPLYAVYDKYFWIESPETENNQQVTKLVRSKVSVDDFVENLIPQVIEEQHVDEATARTRINRAILSQPEVITELLNSIEPNPFEHKVTGWEIPHKWVCEDCKEKGVWSK